MPEKTGGGGHISEAYDPNTGQYVKSGESSAEITAPSDNLALKSALMAFMQAKKEGAVSGQTNSAPLSLLEFNNLVTNCVRQEPNSPVMNTKNLKYALDFGTPEAQRLFYDFFMTTKCKIVRSKEKTCYSPLKDTLYIENAHLTAEGKSGGYIAPGESIYHEFFHAFDNEYTEVTSTFKLSNGKSLRETYFDEIHDSGYAFNNKLFNEVKSGFSNDCMKYLKEDHTQQELNEYYAKNEDLSYKITKKMGKLKAKNPIDYPSYQAYIDDYNKEVTEINTLIKEQNALKNSVVTPSFHKAQHKWVALSDICSFIYKTGTKGSICGGHPAQYWSQMHGKLPVMEIFAELGQKWATGDQEGFDLISKYFPKTAEGFKEIIQSKDKIKKYYLDLKAKAEAIDKAMGF